MEIDRNGLQVLDRAECLELLRTVSVGRIGVTSGALPTILPVNFQVDGDQILIRTGRGSKLDAATRNAVVAFEADEVDASARVGWSVVVTGVAREVSPDDVATLDVSHLDRWAPGEDGRVIAVSLDIVSGRRVITGSAQTL
jgi:nitroimidazol reductase NimA-like FMN-containing flavoprotein (pyridoxamine 5'-phosphate oxidase superfamily)